MCLLRDERSGLARVQTGLAMSRSIGDGALKPVGVVAEADVTHWVLSPEDQFVVVASDGVWEFIPSQEAIEVVARSPSDASAGCQELVRLASERWQVASRFEAQRLLIQRWQLLLPLLRCCCGECCGTAVALSCCHRCLLRRRLLISGSNRDMAGA